MKVALLEIWRHGGTAQYASELAQGLYVSREEQDEVHLITPPNFIAKSNTYQLHNVLPELTGAKVGGKIGNIATLSWLRTRQAKWACYTFEKLKPQIVHVLGTSGVSNYLIRHVREIGAKLVVTVHDLPQGGSAKQFLFNYWSRYFPLADHIIVHGKWSRSQIKLKYGEEVESRTSIIPLGLFDYGKPDRLPHETRKHYKLPQDKFIILFFGSLRRNKGLEVLIQALALEETGQAHLLVTGEQPSKSEPPIEWYRELAKEKGVDERITWIIEYVNNKEIANIFSCADAVALPYMKSFAGQSSVLSIAAAYGVPVLASDVGDIGDTVKEYSLGSCVEAESPLSLADIISKMVPRRELWNNRKSQEFINHSRWTSIGYQHWNLYRSIR